MSLCPTTNAPHRYVTRGHESGDEVAFCRDCFRRAPASPQRPPDTAESHEKAERVSGYPSTPIGGSVASESASGADVFAGCHQHDDVWVPDDADCPLCGLVERSEG